MKKSKQEIKNRILSFTKKRGSEKSVSPTEVTKDLFTDVWKNYVDDVRTAAGELQNKNLVRITQSSKKVRLKDTRGAIRLSLVDGKK